MRAVFVAGWRVLQLEEEYMRTMVVLPAARSSDQMLMDSSTSSECSYHARSGIINCHGGCVYRRCLSCYPGQ